MADCIIAGGAESMSSVPMTGFKPDLNYDVVNSGHEDYYWGMEIRLKQLPTNLKYHVKIKMNLHSIHT